MTPEGVPRDIYVRAANGVGNARLLVQSDTLKHPNDWSPDGEFLIYDDHRVLAPLAVDQAVLPQSSVGVQSLTHRHATVWTVI